MHHYQTLKRRQSGERTRINSDQLGSGVWVLANQDINTGLKQPVFFQTNMFGTIYKWFVIPENGGSNGKMIQHDPTKGWFSGKHEQTMFDYRKVSPFFGPYKVNWVSLPAFLVFLGIGKAAVAGPAKWVLAKRTFETKFRRITSWYLPIVLYDWHSYA